MRAALGEVVRPEEILESRFEAPIVGFVDTLDGPGSVVQGHLLRWPGSGNQRFRAGLLVVFRPAVVKVLEEGGTDGGPATQLRGSSASAS